MSATRERQAKTFIVVMGIVSLFGDMTYEGARGLVGPYLALLGATPVVIGFAAGLGEFLGYGMRLFTGWLGDKTRAYWPLVIAGYSVNFLAVPGLALVGRWEAAVALVLLERIGKAIRSPSRSTLVSYAASSVGHGKGFGIDEALDQLGAVSGPLLTAAVMWGLRAEPVLTRYQVAFGVLLLPVVANVGFALFARTRFPTPETMEAPEQTPAPMGRGFWIFLAAAMLLAFGFSDWALVAFHAGKLGLLGPAELPLVYAGVMAVDALAALGFGVLFDRLGLAVLAVSSLISAAFAPLVFTQTSSALLLAGAACWAIGLGAQESIFKAAIAKLVPKHQRARAYGVFFASFGLAWWAGSTVMGWLYEVSLERLVLVSVVAQLAAVPVFLVVARRVAPQKSG